MKFGMLGKLGISLFAAGVLLASGCTQTTKTTSSGNAGIYDSNMPIVSSFANDFKDIQIPPEMKWLRNESMTIKTESYKGGVGVYTGNIDTLSLKDYLISSMRDKQWRLVGEATANDIMLAFVKPGKTCMMLITDDTFRKSTLTLYVTVEKNRLGQQTEKVNSFRGNSQPMQESIFK